MSDTAVAAPAVPVGLAPADAAAPTAADAGIQGAAAATLAPAAPPVAPCPTCGAPIERQFCGACGEERPEPGKLSLRALGHDLLEEFAHLDSKILRTLWALVARPGQLTADYLAGKRRPYTRPVTLFVTLNIIFFFIIPHTGIFRYELREYMSSDGRTAAVRAEVARRGETLEEYRAKFDAAVAVQRKTVLFFWIPAFALLLKVLHGRRRFYLEHAVFSVHFYAFFLLYLGVGLTTVFALAQMLLQPLGRAGLGPAASLASALGSEPALLAALWAGIGAYLFVALRRVYASGRWRAAATAIVLTASVHYLILAYRELLFIVTYHAL